MFACLQSCCSIKEEELGVDNLVMELDYDQYAGQTLDLNDVVISTDLSEIVDSMCQESINNHQEYPESPPDSGSEHLLSPGSSMINPGFVASLEDYAGPIETAASYTSSSLLPDLSKINYSVPMQMIEEDYKVKTILKLKSIQWILIKFCFPEYCCSRRFCHVQRSI